MSDKKIDHAALIAEAQRQRMNAELREYVHCKPNCSCRADALEAQSALLVADSREALIDVEKATSRHFGSALSRFVDSFNGDEAGDVDYVEALDGNNGWAMRGGNDVESVFAKAIDALLASGVVSLAADRDRAMKAQGWDEGFKQGGPMHDVNYDDPDAHTRNPYRENEGKRAHQAFKENPTAGPDEILAILDRESEGK